MTDTLKEVMKEFNHYRTLWIETHGNDRGFNDWFTSQIQRKIKAKTLIKVGDRMDWKQSMINKVNQEIQLWIETGLTRQEAIAKVKEDSIAGPAVWKKIE